MKKDANGLCVKCGHEPDRCTCPSEVLPGLKAYPVEDWKYEVANDDTILGYDEWVQHQIESHKGDGK
jgi:hypothetical protein